MEVYELDELLEEVAESVEEGDLDITLSRLYANTNFVAVPDYILDYDDWCIVVDAVDPEGIGETRFEDPWMVVLHLYKRIGGRISKI